MFVAVSTATRVILQHSMPRTFLLRREELLSDKGDSCHHELERQSSLPKSVTEAGPSSMKPESPRILGEYRSFTVTDQAIPEEIQNVTAKSSIL